MRTRSFTKILVAILLSAFLNYVYSGVAMAEPRGTGTHPSSQNVTEYPYSESPEGLKHLIQDIFTAVRANDTQKVSNFMDGLTIPHPEQWFTNIFGPSEGPRLAQKQAELHSSTLETVRGRIEASVRAGKDKIEVNTYQKPVDSKLLFMAVVIEDMVHPVIIYDVSVPNGTADQTRTYLGDYVYVEGGFRILDGQVLHALSNAPALRVRVGGNVQAARLVNRVPPVYPAEARSRRIQGNVKLSVLIGIDGKVKEIKPLSGDLLLQGAAEDAVRQWIYQPTLLNGQPVEVETEVDVLFETIR